jgi:hypothetical protein
MVKWSGPSREREAESAWLIVGVQQSSSYMVVQAFLDVLLDITAKGVKLSGGKLPDIGIESIMGVDVLVRKLTRQTRSTFLVMVGSPTFPLLHSHYS